MIGRTNASVSGGSGGGNEKFKALVSGTITELTAEDLEGITYINNQAFSNQSQLESVNMPNGISQIGEGAFYNCSTLSSVLLPSDLQMISGSVFSNCSNLTNIIIPNTVILIDVYCFAYSGLQSIELPDSITYLGGDCFSDCSNLTTVKLPNSLSTIEGNLFFNCSALSSITLPSNLQTIMYNAFYNCSSLTEINLPSTIQNIGSNVFYGCNSLTEMTILATTPPTLESTDAIPDNVETIYVPYGSLQSYQEATNWSHFSEKFVEIELQPTSALVYTQDGDTYFTGTDSQWSATALDSTWTGGELIIPATYNGLPVTRIGKGSFVQINNITDVVILGENLTTIDRQAFTQSSITSIELPKSVTLINANVFNNCANLKTMKVLAETPPTLNNVLPSNVETIYIPTGTLSAYESATNWSASVGKFVEI